MRSFLVAAFAALAVAAPASAQSPCSLGVEVPVWLTVPSPCPDRPLALVASACGPCVRITGWEHPPGQAIRVHATMHLLHACILDVCEPESLAVPLGAFRPGQHRLVVEIVGTVLLPDSAACTVIRRQEVVFDVPMVCPTPPGLPYVDVLRVGAPPPCDPCPAPPICPNRDIPFFIAGQFPDDCFEFRRLELISEAATDPFPRPPLVRVTVGFNDCLGRPCAPMPPPWAASAMLPGLLAGDYTLPVEMQVVSWCDSTRVIARHQTFVSFRVAAACSIPPAPPCFLYDWRRNPADPNCDARVAPGTPARVTLDLHGIVLDGLQGGLALDTHALRITGLRVVGTGATGMRLAWREQPGGASFVAYRDENAACDALECPWGLEVVVSPRPGAAIPAVATLHPRELLGTDALGREVPLCPTFVRIAPARICSGRSCDWNADGRVNVRDLVLMVRCVRDSVQYAGTTGGGFDCDGDGGLGLDDVLCCARVILYGRMPDSVAARQAPDLRVALGDMRVTSTGVAVPVRVERADRVGAARLAFAYPADRFGAARVELLGDAPRWLEISEAEAGELVVGLIATAPGAEGARDLDLVLHFDLAGQSPSTAIRLRSSEFAGTDGVPLAPGASPAPPPPTAIRLDLSPARPNPFGAETRLVLGLSEAATADLAVFDLGGRRVATLHRGQLAAGEHPFVWNGAADDGTRAADGVYFYRGAASGVVATRKLVLLRGGQ